MFYGVKDRFNRAIFGYLTRGIFDTQPVQLNPASPAVVLTQLQHKDVQMFLLALKSFSKYVPICRVYILSDGSVTERDVQTLKSHIPELNFYQLEDFRSTKCPSGACWERILTIAELVKRHYVIQLDGDTLTMDEVPEVVNAIAKGVSFTLGTQDDQVISAMELRCVEAKRTLLKTNTPHVQLISEASFSGLQHYQSMKYVKGCAGFAGFARNSFTREQVESISAEVEGLIGKRWHEWGSEQVMSNVIVSNINGAIVLPHPKFSSCEQLDYLLPAFIHFIGYCRFLKGRYARLARQVLPTL